MRDVLVGDLSDPAVLSRAVDGVHHIQAIATGLVQHEIKRDIEEHLVDSGLDFTILQPANHMLPLKLVPVVERGVFELSWSLDRRQFMVDLDDVTEVACTVLGDPARHVGATYELVGAGGHTAHELGEILSRVLGRRIEVREIDADTYLRAWEGQADPRGLPTAPGSCARSARTTAPTTSSGTRTG